MSENLPDRRERSRRKTDHRGHEKPPWWVRGIILATFVMIAFLAATVIVFTNRVKGYSEQNRQSAISACERGNEARVGDVQNLENDIMRLRAQVVSEQADIDGLRQLDPPPAEWIRSKVDAKAAMLAGIRFKHQSIETKLVSVAEFAESPGSPVIDCQQAYPK